MSQTGVVTSEESVAWVEAFVRVSEEYRVIGDVDLTKEVYGEGALPDRLSDDLASVYSELKGGLDLWSAGDQKREIVWHWTFGFIQHWAQHATSGMRLLWLLMTFGYPDAELESWARR